MFKKASPEFISLLESYAEDGYFKDWKNKVTLRSPLVCIPEVHFISSIILTYVWHYSFPRSWSRRWMARRKSPVTLTTRWHYCASYETPVSTSKLTYKKDDGL